jgi:hypothetical protein
MAIGCSDERFSGGTTSVGTSIRKKRVPMSAPPRISTAMSALASDIVRLEDVSRLLWSRVVASRLLTT